MQIYLVGGAVRDALLGRQVKEKDWVVVGGSVDQMLARGFKPVGKDFPVFLHPETHEEYALARSERKTEPGYKGFVFHADPTVSLEQDLQRRDLTINAIAQDADGNLVDPFGGQQDLKQKILRHVSAAFSEDPVRLLRLARFAAKLPEFTVCPETFAMLQQMVASGEVDALVPERVWREIARALAEQDPCQATALLYNCSAWDKLFPMLKSEYASMQHNLELISKAEASAQVRFAAWCATLAPETIKKLSAHLKIANEYSELARTTAALMQMLPSIVIDEPEHQLNLIEKTDGLRRSSRLETALKICAALQGQDITQAIMRALSKLKQLDLAHCIKQAQQDGKDIKLAVRTARLAALAS